MKNKVRKTAWEAALDSLTRRDFTRHELESRLRERGYSPAEIQATLEKAVGYGYIDDERLALAVAQGRLRRYSRRRVRQDMQNRGFDSRTIEQALEEAYSGSAEFEQCLVLARRWRLQEEKRRVQRSKSESGKDPPQEVAFKQKVAQKLRQRGYSSDMVIAVLELVEEE